MFAIKVFIFLLKNGRVDSRSLRTIKLFSITQCIEPIYQNIHADFVIVGLEGPKFNLAACNNNLVSKIKPVLGMVRTVIKFV